MAFLRLGLLLGGLVARGFGTECAAGRFIAGYTPATTFMSNSCSCGGTTISSASIGTTSCFDLNDIYLYTVDSAYASWWTMGAWAMSTTCANFQVKCEAHSDNPSFYADTTCGTNYCTQCSAGSYSGANWHYCATCAAGSFSNAGSTSCTTVPAGYYQPYSGQGSYYTCPAGSYSSAGWTSCSSCSAGTYSSSGSSGCTNCAVGTYAASTGASWQIVDVRGWNFTTK